MASASTWLGFSLSGQENAQPNQDTSPVAAIDISGGSDFYGLPTQQASDGHLGVDHASYGIMEAFDRGPQEIQGQEAGAPLSPDTLSAYGAHYSMIFLTVS
jgi:AP2-like factor, ANT lineage